jgi:hypothetical protein
MSPARGGCRGELAGAGRGRPGGRARAGRGGRPGLARTPAGWLEGVHRVATRPAPGAPALTRLPDGWWTASPLVRVRRLGLRLDLDRRDNLQQALYATGTYEPALVGFLHDELQRGDVIADVGAHTGVHALTAAARLRRLGGGAVVAVARPGLVLGRPQPPRGDRGRGGPGRRAGHRRPAGRPLLRRRRRRRAVPPRPWDLGPDRSRDHLRHLGRRSPARAPGPGQARRRKGPSWRCSAGWPAHWAGCDPGP